MPRLFLDEAYINQFTSSVRLQVSQSITFATQSLYIKGPLAHGTQGNQLMLRIGSLYGANVDTFGISNHSEGYLSTMSVFTSNNNFSQGTNHIEGAQCTIFGGSAGVHAEGLQNYLSAMNGGHAEGIGNSMAGGGYGATGYIRQWSHVEGSGSVSLSAFSHVEGGANTINWGAQQLNINKGNHLEGYGNRHLAPVPYDHVEGAFNLVPTQVSTNDTQHVQGMYNTSSGDRGCHVEGAYNGQWLIMGNGQDSVHTEGMYNAGALGAYSHIEGFSNSSSLGNGAGGAHTEGCGNVNNFGAYAHVGGYLNASRKIAGVGSSYHYITGVGNYDMTHSGSSAGFIAGTYCTSSAQNFPTASNGAHRASLQVIIGGGVSDTQRANIFEVLGYIAGTFVGTYASRSIILPGVLNSGPYADDASAGSAGVPIGGLYRLYDGVANNQLQIRVS